MDKKDKKVAFYRLLVYNRKVIIGPVLAFDKYCHLSYLRSFEWNDPY